MSTVEQLSSNIKTFRVVMGAFLVASFHATYLYQWVVYGMPGDFMTATFVLSLTVALIGLFGEGAVEAARSIVSSNSK